jgi:ribosomal protein S18 acetylase RimI-like enzyme
MEEASFQIRRGERADAAALAEFAARTFAETFGPANRPEDMAAHLTSSYGLRQQTRELADPNVISLMAEPAGRLAAYAQVRRQPPPDCVPCETPVELWRFYVDRPWHGRGLAQRLMAAVKDAARELDGCCLWLSVWELNPRAIAFYEKCGFRDVGTHSFWLGTDRQTDRVMVAEVARTAPRST